MLLLALGGIAALLVLPLLLPSETIVSPVQLKELKDNQKIVIYGKVIEENIFTNGRRLLFDNNLSVSCSCQDFPLLKGKQLRTEARLERFNNQEKIIALKISPELK